jgi:hypothetical protein
MKLRNMVPDLLIGLEKLDWACKISADADLWKLFLQAESALQSGILSGYPSGLWLIF